VYTERCGQLLRALERERLAPILHRRDVRLCDARPLRQLGLREARTRTHQRQGHAGRYRLTRIGSKERIFPFAPEHRFDYARIFR
jgi:hypothetical protein